MQTKDKKINSIEEFSAIAGSRIFCKPGAIEAFESVFADLIAGHEPTPGCCPSNKSGD